MFLVRRAIFSNRAQAFTTGACWRKALHGSWPEVHFYHCKTILAMLARVQLAADAIELSSCRDLDETIPPRTLISVP